MRQKLVRLSTGRPAGWIWMLCMVAASGCMVIGVALPVVDLLADNLHVLWRLGADAYLLAPGTEHCDLNRVLARFDDQRFANAACDYEHVLLLDFHCFAHATGSMASGKVWGGRGRPVTPGQSSRVAPVRIPVCGEPQPWLAD